jgi:cytoskeletal protein CcmA (bactofilin family)
MFRRTEESEWSRFSKAFPAKDEKKPDGVEETNSTKLNEYAAPTGPEPTVVSSTANNQRAVPEVAIPSPRPAAAPAPALASEEVESTIGRTTCVDGTYRCESGVRIHGTFSQGEIESTKTVFIEESAKVSAKVTAASIVISGEVNGELHCSGRVEIRPSGRVTGTINAASLVMAEGAFFDGNLKMRAANTEGAAKSS